MLVGRACGGSRPTSIRLPQNNVTRAKPPSHTNASFTRSSLLKSSSTHAISAPHQLANAVFLRRLGDFGVHQKPNALEEKRKSISHNQQLQQLAQKGDEQGMLRAFAEMKAKDIQPDGYTFKAFLELYANAANVNKVLEWWDALSATAYTPTIEHFTLVVRGFVKARDVDLAQQFFDMVCEDGLKPDVVMYSELMSAHARRNDVDMVKQLLARMETEELEPDEALFRSLITAYTEARNPVAVEECIDEMQKRGMDTTDIGYRALIHSARLADDVPFLEKLMEDVHRPDSNVELTVVSFGDALCTFAKAGKVDLIKRYLSSMSKHVTEPPSAGFYVGLLSELATRGDTEACTYVLNNMEQSGVIPNIAIFSVLMKMYGRQGNVNAVLHLLQTVQEIKLPMDLAFFTTIISILLKHGAKEAVLPLLYQMKEYNIEADSVLLKMLSDRGISWDNLSVSPEIPMNQIVQEMTTSVKQGDVDGLLDRFDLLRSCGVRRTRSLYSDLLSVAILAQQHNVIETLYNHMKGENLLPVFPVLAQLAELYGKEGKVAAIREVLADMPQFGETVPNTFYDHLLTATINSFPPEQDALFAKRRAVVTLIEEMRAQGTNLSYSFRAQCASVGVHVSSEFRIFSDAESSLLQLAESNQLDTLQTRLLPRATSSSPFAAASSLALGLNVDSDLVGHLMSIFSRVHNSEGMTLMEEVLTKLNLKPNNSIYTARLHHALHTANKPLLTQLVQEAQKLPRPDVPLYTVMLAAAHLIYPAKAPQILALLEKMQKQGVHVNSAAVDKLCRAHTRTPRYFVHMFQQALVDGDMARLSSLLDELRASSVTFDVPLYTTMLAVMETLYPDDISHVKSLVDNMQAAGVQPDNRLRKKLEMFRVRFARRLMQAVTNEDKEQVARLLAQSTSIPFPDHAFYSVLLRGVEVVYDNHPAAVQAIVEDMRSNGLQPDKIFLDSLKYRMIKWTKKLFSFSATESSEATSFISALLKFEMPDSTLCHAMGRAVEMYVPAGETKNSMLATIAHRLVAAQTERAAAGTATQTQH